MTLARARGWLGSRTPLELAALAVAVLVFGWLGWDVPLWDPRQQLVLHLVAASVIVGVTIATIRGAELPRTPLDLPLLALLAAYAVATASAMNLGMSLRAMASVIGFAAMFPVALLAIRHRPSWVGLVTAVPVLALSIPTLVQLLVRRLEWILAGAPGVPPLRLLNEGTLFGSVAVPPFVIWPAWALAGLIDPGPWRRIVRTGLLVTGIPLTVLSGSRSAWLAMGAAVLVGAVPWAWRRRHRLRLERAMTPRTVLVGLGLLGAAALAVVVVVPRVTAIGSLLYRASLWRDTLVAWATDPIFGIGPGFMPYARQAAAPDFSFPVRQPHSHNLPLGVLGDAGLVGLAAGIALIVTALWVAGPWRRRTGVGRTAAIVLLGLAVGGLFEDLTFLPNFNLLAITLLAVALTDAGAVRWASLPAPGSRWAAAAGVLLLAVALAPGVAVADAGAIAHRAGIDAWLDDDPAAATDHLVFASSVDPWHPAVPKALTVAADAASDPALARRAAERAVALNPGDGASWTNLALLCLDVGDEACTSRAAQRAAATASFLGLEPANAALVHEALGDTEAADDAYRLSLLSQRLTAFGLDWPRDVPVGDARLSEDHGPIGQVNLLLAWWAVGEPFDLDALTDPAVRALAHAMLGEDQAVPALLDEAIAATPDEPLPWQVLIVLRTDRGEPVDDALRAWHALAGRDFPDRDAPVDPPTTTDDIASFRTYPADELVHGADRLVSRPTWPWVILETLP